MNRHIIPVEQLHEFATAGNAVCTIKSKSTGQHRTIKIINAGDSDFYRVYIRGEKWIELGRFRATTPAVNRTTVSWFLRVLSGDISLERGRRTGGILARGPVRRLWTPVDRPCLDRHRLRADLQPAKGAVMVGLYQRKGSASWYYRYRVAGKRVTVSTKCESRKDAERFVRDNLLPLIEARTAEELATRTKHLLSGYQVCRLSDCWQVFLDNPANRPQAASRQATVFARWMKVCSYLNLAGIERTDQVSVTVARAWWNDVDSGTLSASTRNDTLSIAQRVMRESGVDSFNDLPRWKAQKGATRREAFTRDQLDIIAQHSAHHVFGLFCVGLNTGLSLADVCRLRWSEVDLAERWIRTTRQKTGANLVIPILPPLWEYLSGLSQDCVAVFPEWEELYVNSRMKVSREIQDFLVYECGFETTDRSQPGRARMKLGFHSCRHTFAYLAEAAGVPLSVIQSIVGHFSPEMTQRYLAHAQESVIREAVKCLHPGGEIVADLGGRLGYGVDRRDQTAQLGD